MAGRDNRVRKGIVGGGKREAVRSYRFRLVPEQGSRKDGIGDGFVFAVSVSRPAAVKKLSWDGYGRRVNRSECTP